MLSRVAKRYANPGIKHVKQLSLSHRPNEQNVLVFDQMFVHVQVLLNKIKDIKHDQTRCTK